MSTWAERAKARFSQMPPEPTPKTPETPLLGVLGAPPQHLCEKTEGTFGGFGGSYLAHPEKTALPAMAPDWTPPALLPDPGPAHLLALAMALCERTGASNQERADWRSDIEQAAPEHRGHLLTLVQCLMPKPPPTALEIAAPDPKRLPLFHVAQPWNVADKAYQAHHWNCDACKAAARSGGSSQRCATGQHLHQLYEQAFEAAKES